jgi:hypothetical protein
MKTELIAKTTENRRDDFYSRTLTRTLNTSKRTVLLQTMSTFYKAYEEEKIKELMVGCIIYFVQSFNFI